MTRLEGFTPFPPEFIESYLSKGYWENRTLSDFFSDICSRFSQKVAVVAGEETITYQVLGQRTERLALHLHKLGLKPLDPVIMQIPNTPEFIYLYFALQKIGALPVMALPPHRYSEISQFATLSRAVGYAFPERMGDFNFLELAARIQQETPTLRFLFVAGDVQNQTDTSGVISLSKLLQTDSGLTASEFTKLEIDPTSPALFQLSGGTTGTSKLIPRTHNDYLYNTKVSAEVTDIRAEDSLLVVLPMAHNFPLACPGVQGFLMYGARNVLSTSTKTEEILQLVEKHRITHLELVPTLLIRLVNDPQFKNFDLSSLRVINSGGQKLQSEVKRLTEQLLPGCKVQEVFGMAEGLLCYVRLDDPIEVRYETVGRPVSEGDEIRIVDGDGNEVPDGETGELLVRGPYTLRGYFRAPEQNARSFTPDGFYRSGDLMRRTASGHYVVEGRMKDLINRAGEKISAEEIENAILAHPNVLNVACVPMPDPILGERVCAFVIPKVGEPLTLDQLTAFLLQRGIAKFKLPERLEVVEEFPLSKVGKVAKNILSKLAMERSKVL